MDCVEEIQVSKRLFLSFLLIVLSIVIFEYFHKHHPTHNFATAHINKPDELADTKPSDDHNLVSKQKPSAQVLAGTIAPQGQPKDEAGIAQINPDKKHNN